MDRRQFLSISAASAAIAITGATRAYGSASMPHALGQPDLLVALGPDAVREIGRAYRALVPSDNDRATLDAALRAELRAAHSSNEDLVRADFAAGRTIVVRDWILSRTEARQCALFSLLSA
ncbi:MAG TPA: hypothetical protein VF461_22530 [Gemmatimonadaceae bacterium]